MQCSPNNDQSERQTIMKFQGDLLFQKQNYSEALVKYQESRQCLPPNNTVLDRELIESMAICLLKLGKCDDAVMLLKEAMVSEIYYLCLTRSVTIFLVLMILEWLSAIVTRVQHIVKIC